MKDTGVRALANHCKDLGKSPFTPPDPFVRFFSISKCFLAFLGILLGRCLSFVDDNLSKGESEIIQKLNFHSLIYIQHYFIVNIVASIPVCLLSKSHQEKILSTSFEIY